PKAASTRETGVKKTSSPGRRISEAVVAVANVASRFNLGVSRKVNNMANRADNKPAARVRAKERKAKLRQLHLRGNQRKLDLGRLRISGAVFFCLGSAGCLRSPRR